MSWIWIECGFYTSKRSIRHRATQLQLTMPILKYLGIIGRDELTLLGYDLVSYYSQLIELN